MIQFSNPLYDRLKFLAQVVLPALGTLYFTLAGIWNWGSAEAVVSTIVAVDTFLGVVLQLSSTAYKKDASNFDGSLDVEQKPGGTKLYSLNLNRDPEQLENSKIVQFQVRKLK